ncbi:sensor histidine kinase [Oceanirhabdus sp. W0125-5]|uniref:sensor histidine kinase n=1 Tax=Oceanirhabdus sp. W0125-5 TaxID=2999116 RepID=UPI0022F2F43F|nr:sensor histidine kinase [Oceanirhabdus sp. W0125-5]WBW97195.1 sensor histidine kinase [Oceanirhabdus sp. W0125-5]
MIIILGLIIVILIAVICFQYFSIKERNNNLSYIEKKLESIIQKNSSEKLLVVTDDDYLTSILVQINNVLEHNQKVIADHKSTQESMRKMLSNISHDFKTPLTVILGYIETLSINDNLSSEEKEIFLSNVQNKASELLALINRFFTLSKIESGDKEISITRINISEICRKNILSFYDILSDKGFDVNINIPAENLYALSNEEAMERILNNLISNVIKYGYEGKSLGIDLSGDEEWIYIDIWDKGRGIDELHKDRIFERLYTLEDSRNKEFQGSGLGLTITKRLVEKMNGEISLSSIPYEKTTFSLKLKRINY